jgi:hypothetical protein
MAKRTWITESWDPFAWMLKIALQIEQAGDCWRWTGSMDRYGYGQLSLLRPDGTRTGTGAHRASWLAHRGDIPPGLMTDHLCRNSACVNPWHMELVTNQINVQRGYAVRPPEQRKHRAPRPKLGCRKHGKINGMESRDGRWRCYTCREANEMKDLEKALERIDADLRAGLIRPSSSRHV